MMVEIGLVQVLVSSRSLGECKSGLRACLRIGAADRDYVRNYADRDDERYGADLDGVRTATRSRRGAEVVRSRRPVV